MSDERERHGPSPWLRAAAAGLAGGAVVTALGAVVHTIAPSIPFLPVALAQAFVRAAPGGFATAAIDLLGHWALRLAAAGTAALFVLSGAAAGLLAHALRRSFRDSRPAAWIAGFVPFWAVS